MPISDCTFAATVTFTVPGARMLAIKSAAVRDQSMEEAPICLADAQGFFDMMLRYQKALNKEHRADKEALRADEKLEREARIAMLALECAKIDQMKEEAAERAQHQNSSGKKSDQTQIQINNQQKEIDKAGRRVDESRDACDAARDRKRIALDSIQKFLDILRSMPPQI